MTDLEIISLLARMHLTAIKTRHQYPTMDSRQTGYEIIIDELAAALKGIAIGNNSRLEVEMLQDMWLTISSECGDEGAERLYAAWAGQLGKALT